MTMKPAYMAPASTVLRRMSPLISRSRILRIERPVGAGCAAYRVVRRQSLLPNAESCALNRPSAAVASS
jgi:hypothetical protein